MFVSVSLEGTDKHKKRRHCESRTHKDEPVVGREHVSLLGVVDGAASLGLRRESKRSQINK